MLFSPQARQLLTHLLTRDPQYRLGSGERDAGELKVHPFFANVNWDNLATGNVTPPWKPEVYGSLDVSNFDNEFVSQAPIGRLL